MSNSKNVIVKFKKEATTENKAKVIDDIKNNGGQVVKDDNLNSTIFPFITVKLPEEHFHSLHSETISGNHHSVEHVEEDGEMKIQI